MGFGRSNEMVIRFGQPPLEHRELGRKEISGHIKRYPESVPTTPL